MPWSLTLCDGVFEMVLLRTVFGCDYKWRFDLSEAAVKLGTAATALWACMQVHSAFKQWASARTWMLEPSAWVHWSKAQATSEEAAVLLPAAAAH